MRPYTSSVILFVTLLLTAGGVNADPQPKKLALLVGISEYKDSSIRALGGATNDVERMHYVLAQYGFEKENIITMTNKSATQKEILDKFQTHLVDKANKNDIIVFYYSGHGAQVLDQVNGDEDDGLDETIVPYDSNAAGDRDIRDDKLNELIGELSKKTRHITFIFDSCTSGTLSRGAESARFIERKLKPRIAATRSATTRGTKSKPSGMMDKDSAFTLLAAAEAGELAREYQAENKLSYGAFTYHFTTQLLKKEQDVTYLDLYDVVKKLVNADNPGQHPTLEGTEANTLVFTTQRVTQQPFILASPDKNSSDTVKLEAGQVHGITRGSVFAVHPPKTRNFETSQAIATATIETVHANVSEARLNKKIQIPAAARAVEIKHNFGDKQLYIHLVNVGQSSVLKAIKSRLEEYDFIRLLDKAEHYHLLLEHRQDEILIEAADSGARGRFRTDIKQSELIEQVVDNVAMWAKWYGTLSINNPNPSPDARIRISVVAQTRGGKRRSAYSYAGTPDAEFRERETIILKIKNRSKHDLNFAVLDLSTDGSVVIAYPDNNLTEKLPKLETTEVELETCLPKDRDSVTDVLKVFASKQPLDFNFLAQPPLTRGKQKDLNLKEPVEQLVAHHALGTRAPGKPIDLDSWVSAERVIRVVRVAQDDPSKKPPAPCPE